MVDFEIVDIIRKIVESEIKKLHVAEIGIVTSVFPHSSESDSDNYECNVKLKYKELELRRVPVATQHIGLANIPHVGDLVLITFVNGDVNAPVIIGRLYNDEDRPPISNEEEVVYAPPYSENSKLRRFHMELPGGMALSISDNTVKIEAGKTTLNIKRDGSVSIHSAGSVSISADGNLSLSANNIALKSKQAIDIKSKTLNIKSDKSDQDIKMMKIKDVNFELEADALVKLKSSANLDIEGTIGTLNMSGPLTIKGAIVNIN